MEMIETLIARNRVFASGRFSTKPKMLPSTRTVIIGCVDPRVDPTDIFGLEPGEAVVIRNVGGRPNTALLEVIEILQTVARVAGKDIGEGWNLIVLQHTDCGIVGCFRHDPELLARHLDVTLSALDRMAIDDPRKAVAMDVASLSMDPRLPTGLVISGIVYDVGTGKIDVVVPPATLDHEAAD